MTVQGVDQTSTPKLPQGFQLDTWKTVLTKELTNQTQLNSNGGVFSPNGVKITDSNERDYLNGIKDDMDQIGMGPENYMAPNSSAANAIYMDLARNDGRTPEQRLAQMMSVLGPDRMYVVLANMPPDMMQKLGIQDSFNKLVANGTFTADDAKKLADAQANAPTFWQHQYDSGGITNTRYNDLDPTLVGKLISSLPNDQKGSAIKLAYAQESMVAAQKLKDEITSGKYSGPVLDQLNANLNAIANNVDNLTTNFSDQDKISFFNQLHTLATQFADKGDTKHADLLNAYAADVLGSLSDKSQIATILRHDMGGVGADGYIDPNSNLAKFLNSALSGSAQFKPGSPIPQGVTGLLNGIANSGDTKLMAGTLDTVMQWSIAHPKDAKVLAAQDTMSKDGTSTGTGYRDALTSLLDRSFNQFIALDPANPNSTGPIRTLQPQVMDDLQVMSAIEMGPPYNSKSVTNFATVYMQHAAQFAGYAFDPAKFPLAGPLVDGRHSSAVVFGQLINSFAAGLNKSETSLLAQAHDAKAAADLQLMEERVTTDVLRSLGTGLLLASAWVTGGPSVPIALGLAVPTKEFIGILGRIGLFSGSVGTLVLDQWGTPASTRNQAQSLDDLYQSVYQQIQASHKTGTRLILDSYNGWFSQLSHIPGPEGQSITDGLLLGSGSAAAPTVDMAVQGFYRDY